MPTILHTIWFNRSEPTNKETLWIRPINEGTYAIYIYGVDAWEMIASNDPGQFAVTPWIFGTGEHSAVIGGNSNTSASGAFSLVEGRWGVANGDYSHAEGITTEANGMGSHVEGRGTITENEYEHAGGIFNFSHRTSPTFGHPKNTMFSIGIGDSPNVRRNAFEIMQNGDIYVYGIGTYDGSNLDTAFSLQTVVTSGRNTQSDWAQYDTSVIDYIKNRTHWEEPTAEPIVTGPISPQLRYSVKSHVGDEYIYNFYIEGKDSDNSTVTLSNECVNNGNIYTVKGYRFSFDIELTPVSGAGYTHYNISKLQLNDSSKNFYRFTEIEGRGVGTAGAFTLYSLSPVTDIDIEFNERNGRYYPILYYVTGTEVHKLDNKFLNIDQIPTQDSTNVVSSGGVYNSLSTKLDDALFEVFYDNTEGTEITQALQEGKLPYTNWEGNLYYAYSDEDWHYFTGVTHEYNESTNEDEVEVRIVKISLDSDSADRQRIRLGTGIDIAKISIGTTNSWTGSHYVPKRGEIVVYTDKGTKTVSGQTVNIPGIKIGGGNAYVEDIAFVDEDVAIALNNHINNGEIHITQAERTFWNGKVSIDESQAENKILAFTID